MGTLFQELQYQKKAPLMYYPIFVTRRLIYALVCVYCTDFPFAQVMIFIFKCELVIIYIYYFQPFESPLMNRTEMFNELCILVIALHLPLCTDFVEDAYLQYKIGYSVLAFTFFNIFVNMTLILTFGVFTLVRSLKRYFRLLMIKLKSRKHKKYQLSRRENILRNPDIIVEEFETGKQALSREKEEIVLVDLEKIGQSQIMSKEDHQIQNLGGNLAKKRKNKHIKSSGKTTRLPRAEIKQEKSQMSYQMKEIETSENSNKSRKVSNFTNHRQNESVRQLKRKEQIWGPELQQTSQCDQPDSKSRLVGESLILKDYAISELGRKNQEGFFIRQGFYD